MSAEVAFREITDWPFLLVGPIVRRVTRTEAWVFVATKSPCSARLLVAEAPQTSPQTGDPPSPASLTPAEMPDDPDPGVALRAIGEHLHVGLLHARLPAETPDTTYAYDVQFTETLAGGATHTFRLADLELLGPASTNREHIVTTSVPLGYQVGYLPSFVTPPENLDDLRIAQGSCRKAHGNTSEAAEHDALPIIDELIGLGVGHRTARSEPDHVAVPVGPVPSVTWYDALGNAVTAPDYPPPELRKRPHQLVLTGDQIYADDVAPAMLDVLRDASTKLLGWEETPPGIAPGMNGFLVEPGWRTRYLSIPGVKEIPADDHPDYSQSHLLTFGEWCAMYCMAWSDALWPRNEDGTGVSLRDAEHRIKVNEIIEVLETYEKLPYAKIPARWNKLLMALKVAKHLDEFDEKIDQIWTETKDLAVGYGSTVPYVRRVLANVATYTMFDDHEMTDDWFLNKDVAGRLLGLDGEPVDWWSEDVGPRLLRNGLSAYAFFQHWGNEPDDFDGWDVAGPLSAASGRSGCRLLALWEPGADGRPPLAGPPVSVDPLDQFVAGFPFWAIVPDIVPPSPEVLDQRLADIADHWMLADQTAHPDTRQADDLLRIADYPTDDATGLFPGTGDPADRANFAHFRWDWAVAFDCHRLVALDTRTWRRFPTGPTPIGSLSGTSPHDRTEAQGATAEYLADYAAAWQATGTSAGVAVGDLIAAVHDVATAAGSSLDAVLDDLADALDAFLDAVAVSVTVTATARLVVDEFRAGLSATAEFDARLELSTDDRKLWRVAALLDQLAGLYENEGDDPAIEVVTRMCFALGDYVEAVTGGSVRAAAEALRRIALDAGAVLIHDTDSPLVDPAGGRALVVAALNAMVDAAAQLDASYGLHDRSDVFFRDGTGHLAAELIAEPALQWMVTEPLRTVGPGLETVVLSSAPVFGDEAIEWVQRLGVVHGAAKGIASAEEYDFEAWTANPAGFDNFLRALGTDCRRAVILSGDVHYAGSSVNRVRIGADSVDSCFVQLTSSATKNSDAITKRLGLGVDFGWDDDGRSKLHRLNPSALLRRDWDFFVPPPNTPPAPAGPSGPSFVGWLGEYLTETLEETAREYHLDDLAKMYEELFTTVRSPSGYWAWHGRWVRQPAKRGLLHLFKKSPEYVEAAFEWLSEAPGHSFVAWFHEAAWLSMDTVQQLQKIRHDPVKELFGHWLYSRDVLIQQAADAYKALGVDPHYGVQITRRSLRDTRADRLVHYGARDRWFADLQEDGAPSDSYLYAHSQEVQTVGSANVGIVTFHRGPSGRVQVRHDLLSYPDPSNPLAPLPDLPGPWAPSDVEDPDPGEVTTVPEVRDDWIGTVHEAWFPFVTEGEFDDLLPPDSDSDDGPLLG